MDIRKFFKPVASKAPPADAKPEKINSDDEDIPVSSKLARKKRNGASSSGSSNNSNNSKKRRNRMAIFSSSEDEEEDKGKKNGKDERAVKKTKVDEGAKKIAPIPPAPPKKVIQPTDFFGKKRLREEDVHDDEDFKKTLKKVSMATDAGAIAAEVAKGKKHSPSTEIPKPRSPSPKRKASTPQRKPDSSKKSQETETKQKTPKARSPSPKKKEESSKKAEKSEPKLKTPHRSISDGSESDGHHDVVDKTPQEKKKEHFMNYQKYLQRGGPPHPGSKKVPEGEENCFKGLSFVVTGVMDSLHREEMEEIIKQYGGHVATSVTRKVTHIVVGVEPGPSKMKKATELKTKTLTEDEFLALITSKSEEVRKTGSKDVFEEEKPKKVAKKKEEEKPVKKEEPPKKSPEIKKPEVKAEKKPLPPKVKKEEEPERKKPEGPVGDPSIVGEDLWVDKWKPKTSKQIIGQQGDRSNAAKLRRWLQDWNKNWGDPNKKVKAAGMFSKDDWGATFKAALLSGPPGVGKTTTANIVAKELGFDIVELNASDARNKKALDQQVHTLLSNNAVTGFLTYSSKRLIIMDEVDGMAGNEDRGGVAELIKFIRLSKIPVICICNDRNHQKIRSLANYCFDLRFSKPRTEQIKAAMLTVCFREGIKVPPDALVDMIECSNHDVRQVLNHLSVWTANQKQLGSQATKGDAERSKKDLKFGPWDVVKQVFTKSEHEGKSLNDKAALFFQDYSLGPLFVQENYLSVNPAAARSGDKKKLAELVSKTADSLCQSDMIEKVIRSGNAWSLLPSQAIFASVIPGDCMAGYFSGQPVFPSWLGKNSRRNKFDRLLQELSFHMRLSTDGAGKLSINEDYLELLKTKIFKPLATRGADGIPDSLGTLDAYYLLREDLESIVELTAWPGGKDGDPMSKIDSKVKAAFTRAYNKENRLNPYSQGISIAKGRGGGGDVGLDGEDEGGDEEEAEEDESDPTKDNMIKVVQPKASKKKTKDEDGPSTSSGRGGRGGGRGSRGGARGGGPGSRGGRGGRGKGK